MDIFRTRDALVLALLAGFFIFFNYLINPPVRVSADAYAGTNVTSTAGKYYAWNDIVGWIDFHTTHNVKVMSNKIAGWASSTAGVISLDCTTSPAGDICLPSPNEYRVKNDGSGLLSGYAWNDNYGWISFCGGLLTRDCPGTIPYRASVDASGTFSGWGWNDIIGWISFCGGSNTATCPGSIDYKIIADLSYSGELYYAWNDILHWIDFGENFASTTGKQMKGYASSTAGPISLDCATSPAGNICGTSDYHVNNDGSGNLSGWAWNDIFGWFSFCGGSNSADCPGSINYRVLIDAPRKPNESVFHGYAWNDILGWTSFNCEEPGLCDGYNYKVITSWVATSSAGYLESSTFDTGIADGAQLNSFYYTGDRPADTNVFFQFAVGNSSSGPWTYIGPDGTSNSFYSSISPDTVTALRALDFANVRYFRYKVRLESNVGGSAAPRIDTMVVNWSP